MENKIIKEIWVGLRDILRVRSVFTYEIIRNPDNEKIRKRLAIIAKREKKVAFLGNIHPKSNIRSLTRAIEVLQIHGKPLTQEELSSKAGGKSGDFDLDAFKKIGKAAIYFGILIKPTNRYGSYGLPEWEI